MNALLEMLSIMAIAVVGVFFYKLSMAVLPANVVTDPFKKIGAFL